MISYPKTLNQSFFNKHKKIFSFFLNSFIIGYIFRKILKINLNTKEKIEKLHPNGYSVRVDKNKFRAELSYYDYISVELYKNFSWLFSIFHNFDIYIANRICPKINLGFDEYEEPEIGIVVFGTAARGFIDYNYEFDYNEIRNSEGTASASNINITARMLASDDNQYCYFARGIISYNTSFLTYNDIVTEAGLRLQLVIPGNYTSFFNNDDLIITSHDKVTSLIFETNDIVNEDYNIDMFGTIPFCNMTWDEYTVEAPSVRMFYLNEDGLSYIKREAHTAFGFMVEQDFINEEQIDPYPVVGDDTQYTLTAASTGVSFVFTYYSIENQIVMNM